MLCTFCGTDNRPENKFCGMCGVRLERRKVERRVHQKNTASSKCPSCDHVNEHGHKFCAMCGGRVDRRVSERRTGADEQPRAAAIANAQIPGPEGPPVATAEAVTLPEPTEEVVEAQPPLARPAPPVFHGASDRTPATITGPSFLGLSDDPRDRADYLLEEDEGSSGGVLRKLVMVAVLAAVGGLIFMQWRAGFPLLHNIPSFGGSPKTEAARSPQEPNPAPTPAANEEANTVSTVPDLAKDVSAPAHEAPSEKVKSPDTAPVEKANQPVAPSDASASKTEPRADNSSGVKAKVTKDNQEKPSPMLLRAQAYLQGTGGVPQNCEQGLVYLRTAAKTEAAAAVQMGALYASGHCVEQNRVEAYRWLNSAHELQPGNSRIQSGMNQLWAQMTQQERSQIVR
jgi:hypothetical protein